MKSYLGCVLATLFFATQSFAVEIIMPKNSTSYHADKDGKWVQAPQEYYAVQFPSPEKDQKIVTIDIAANMQWGDIYQIEFSAKYLVDSCNDYSHIGKVSSQYLKGGELVHTLEIDPAGPMATRMLCPDNKTQETLIPVTYSETDYNGNSVSTYKDLSNKKLVFYVRKDVQVQVKFFKNPTPAKKGTIVELK